MDCTGHREAGPRDGAPAHALGCESSAPSNDEGRMRPRVGAAGRVGEFWLVGVSCGVPVWQERSPCNQRQSASQLCAAVLLEVGNRERMVSEVATGSCR